MKTEHIDNLIILSETKTNLLKELRDSCIYESKTYDLNMFDMGFEKSYILTLISSKKEVVSGRLAKIKSYINLHKIDINSIYNNKKLLPKIEE